METGKGKAERDRKQGLNRTMQYGNFFSEAIRFKVDIGLNRTMQYGNLFVATPPRKGKSV